MIGKAELLEAIAGVNRGLLAKASDRLAINAAIAQLEDRNPTPQPLAAPELLEGNWRLLYTTSDDLLGIDRFPLIELGNIYQCIRPETAKIYNIAELKGLPFLDGVVTVSATFTPVSEKRVEVQFERSIIGLQRLLEYQSPAAWIERINQPSSLRAIDFAIASDRRPGWLEVTYLDADLRIGRGNEGSLFVLTKR